MKNGKLRTTTYHMPPDVIHTYTMIYKEFLPKIKKSNPNLFKSLTLILRRKEIKDTMQPDKIRTVYRTHIWYLQK